VRGSVINSPRGNVVASPGEVAMFFAISDFSTVNRAALATARAAVGAAGSSRDGGNWA
jgi:hypothetical protein